MVKICSDSCCDLTAEQLKENNIATIPLFVTLGEDDYLDGVSIQPDDIYEYVKKTKQLPKTAARSTEDFKEFFEIYVKSMDSNMRVSKARYSSYTFNSENLISLNLEELTHHEFVLYADKTWVNNEGKEGSTKAIETDDLQLKIINILKSYIQYKISD